MLTPQSNTQPLDINEFMLKWNTMYPFDRWWRMKHGVAFGSKKHRKANFLDMVFEFREDLYFKKLAKQPDEDVKFTDQEREDLDLGAAPRPKEVKMSKVEIDEEFDNLDLTQFNEQ